MDVLGNGAVRQALSAAWQESKPGEADCCEQGGFVLAAPDGNLSVERWPIGAKNRIAVPPHAECRRGDLNIIATFHTHPNLGEIDQQEPSLTDIRAVREDPDLGGAEYEEEIVISKEWVYRVLRSGRFDVVGPTAEILDPSATGSAPQTRAPA